jgi:hypothetical protein
MFKQDLEVIDNLRRDAVNVKEPHVSGVKKIAAYAAQLAWIGGKFPIDVCYGHEDTSGDNGRLIGSLVDRRVL